MEARRRRADDEVKTRWRRTAEVRGDHLERGQLDRRRLQPFQADERAGGGVAVDAPHNYAHRAWTAPDPPGLIAAALKALSTR